jgi:undecaprenyl diphosphate synthase
MSSATPKHIAFIMDGNGRWAEKQGLQRLMGHKKGADVVKSTVQMCAEHGVEYVTFFAFSMENWKRSKEEVNGLMELLRQYFRTEFSSIMEKNIRMRFIGDRTGQSKLPKDISQMFAGIEEKTRNNTGITVVFAINYSGRDEIVRAAQLFAEDVDTGRRYASDFDEGIFSDYLDTISIPDPDLVIRTSGEKRLSNFLLWQMAYSELYFTQTSWPDFSSDDLNQALESYSERNRRFGAA